MKRYRNYHFVRVNGDTAHNDPSKAECLLPGEPPIWPNTYFDYRDYCLTNGIVRSGWPGTGDLKGSLPVPHSTRCYGDLDSHVRGYLDDFRQIELDDVILMPDKDRPGILFVGTVTRGYHYFWRHPAHLFECAHRVGVQWDQWSRMPAEYQANDFGIGIRGGFWTRAYYRFDVNTQPDYVRKIDQRRER